MEHYIKHFLVIFGVVILCSCNRVSQPIDVITKVELARTGAWSDLGAQLSVDSSLTLKYYGRTEKIDQYLYYIGKVSPQFWDSVNIKLAEINFKTIPVTDNRNTLHANHFELIVHWKHGKKRIERTMDYTSKDSVLRVLEWLNYKYKNVKLRQIKDSIKFETTFQNPPKPKVEQIRFPPPIIGKKTNAEEGLLI